MPFLIRHQLTKVGAARGWAPNHWVEPPSFPKSQFLAMLQKDGSQPASLFGCSLQPFLPRCWVITTDNWASFTFRNAAHLDIFMAKGFVWCASRISDPKKTISTKGISPQAPDFSAIWTHESWWWTINHSRCEPCASRAYLWIWEFCGLSKRWDLPCQESTLMLKELTLVLTSERWKPFIFFGT